MSMMERLIMDKFIRPPPSFQFYPSNVMSTIQYRTMSLAERGLMMTIQNECWVNKSIPSDIGILAKMLGYSENEVKLTLTSNVMHFFSKTDDKIISPELVAYREYLDERRRAQIEGGKEGARRKKEKERASNFPQGIPEGSLVEHNLTENNLLEQSPLENKISRPVFRKRELPVENNLEKHKDFIQGMDDTESYF
jgi:uncharacterized protein YdaU (DUF1376 family)